ncbi:AraC family transcriptional regulator [Lachnospiraceae bacterium]|uniref:helix-turn-helix domain-containing protein n=1 Tax=Extibacter sp. GGCC_0201 TaxID=2731209 RepID=UPI001AA1240F|nr:helix-turn-helix domain-containing protein [Extibacter sp. GGCC_0201]MBO1720578.1 AraC family transcriptional regulator [Extibacter sp. GGCC_0201]BDF34738.1 AraC family transcriptional regulator [Lachnospiraceae bacterium]BDF38740.1 AraC family transcriptional regulator [Lachnospiraceae bacterium]
MIDKSSLQHINEKREILIREENFAYMLPCGQLRNLISNFTVTFPDRQAISDAYTVMPHGSVTLVLFDYHTELHSFIFGPATKPVRVGDIANRCDVIFIVEFQPAGFSAFKKRNQNELTDKIVPFKEVDSSMDKEMRDIFRTSVTVEGLLCGMEERLIQSVRFPYPEELARAIGDIIRMEGILTSVEISDKVNYSPRHLNRLFNLYLGMSMKSFSRLVRINRAIRLLNEEGYALAYISDKLGYYDVSHLVKDFRLVCGITPQEYRSNMSDFYSEIAKY